VGARCIPPAHFRISQLCFIMTIQRRPLVFSFHAPPLSLTFFFSSSPHPVSCPTAATCALPLSTLLRPTRRCILVLASSGTRTHNPSKLTCSLLGWQSEFVAEQDSGASRVGRGRHSAADAEQRQPPHPLRQHRLSRRHGRRCRARCCLRQLRGGRRVRVERQHRSHCAWVSHVVGGKPLRWVGAGVRSRGCNVRSHALIWQFLPFFAAGG
jgi:hypothetical protein